MNRARPMAAWLINVPDVQKYLAHHMSVFADGKK